MASANLVLDAASLPKVAQLSVLCHRCGFYNAPEYETLSKPLTKVAASIRIVGTSNGAAAPWIDVTNANVTMPDNERFHGGINGGMLTVRFRLPVDATTRGRLSAGPGLNRIEFRFNGTDGNSNGYRILDLQLQDASGNNLTNMPRQWADIGAEKVAGRSASATDVAAGQSLWSQGGVLTKSAVVSTKLRASCSSCHASDGRDIQYFNYSNNAIVMRSQFHGLTAQQGGQIVAYLRSTLYSKVPHVPAATPWNPPYQPGSGLDSKPVAEWAAGAGLAAVLPDGKAFMKALLGKPIDGSALSITQDQLDAAMSPSATMNTREMPIALQLPDWNAWLPTVHPLDVWTPDSGEAKGLFETGKNGANPLKAFADLRALLNSLKNPNGAYSDWTNLTADQRDQVQGMLNAMGNQTTGFAGGGRGNRISGATGNARNAVEIGGEKMRARLNAATASAADLTTCGPMGPCTPFGLEAFIERADYGLFHWMAVKQWEVAQGYGLEEPPMHGSKDPSTGKWVPNGEKRGWAYDWPSVFFLAPHMLYQAPVSSSDQRDNYFSWENRLISFYRTNQWYQLQMTVNPGWKGMIGPMDWPYHMGFTTALVDDLTTAGAPAALPAMHVARWQQIRAKVSQLANTDISFNGPVDPGKPFDIDNNTGFNSKADLLFKIAPTPLMDLGPAPWQKAVYPVVNDIYPGLYLMFVNSSIASYNTLFANTVPSQYRKCDPSNGALGVRDGHGEDWAGQRFCADKARTPLPNDNNNGYPGVYLPYDGKWTTEQYIAWGIRTATANGAEPTRLKTWSDWYNRMWPQ